MESRAGAPATVEGESLPAVGRSSVFFVVALVAFLGAWAWARHMLSIQPDTFKMGILSHLFVRYDVPSLPYLAGTLVVALPAAFLVPPRWFDRMAQWVAENPTLFALLSFAGLAACSYWAYDDYPLSLDEYAQYFQAQIFAGGSLHGHYPPHMAAGLIPVPGSFIQFSRTTGETMSGYWPGLPLILAPFMFLGLPWIANPVVGVIGLLALRTLSLRLMPETPRAAGWAMLFMLASPAFSVNAISYYAMNAYLTLGLLYAVLLFDVTPKRLVLAGVVGSFALVQHNPVPHTLFAIPWLIWLAVRPGRVRNLFWIAVGYLPLTIVLFFGWWWLKARLSFGDDIPATGASPMPVWEQLAAFLNNHVWSLPTIQIALTRLMGALKVYLWAVPGLPVICFWGYQRIRTAPVARLLTWSAIVTFAAYFLVDADQGHGWGYRYFHPVWAVLPLFGAAWVTEPRAGFKWAPFMGAAAVLSLIVVTPLRMWQVHDFIHTEEAMAPVGDPAKDQLIFVNTGSGPGLYYAQDAIRNDPFLRNKSVMLRSGEFEKDEQFIKDNYPAAKLVSRTIHGSVWDLPSTGS